MLCRVHLLTTGHLSTIHPVVVVEVCVVGVAAAGLLSAWVSSDSCQLQAVCRFLSHQCRSFVEMCTVSFVLARAQEGG